MIVPSASTLPALFGKSNLPNESTRHAPLPAGSNWRTELGVADPARPIDGRTGDAADVARLAHVERPVGQQVAERVEGESGAAPFRGAEHVRPVSDHKGGARFHRSAGDRHRVSSILAEEELAPVWGALSTGAFGTHVHAHDDAAVPGEGAGDVASHGAQVTGVGAGQKRTEPEHGDRIARRGDDGRCQRVGAGSAAADAMGCRKA